MKNPSSHNNLEETSAQIPGSDILYSSIVEMLALPEHERNTLAIRLCASFPDPIQLMVLCSSEDAYKAVSEEVLRREQQGPRELSIAEILALPEDERNALAKVKGVVCWDPYTVMAIGCAPPDNSYLPSHEEMKRYMQECGPLPDEEEDKNSDACRSVVDK